MPTPNAPTNMSILSTRRKFDQAVRTPAPAQIAYVPRFPAVAASVSDLVPPTKPGTPVGVQSGSQIVWTWTASTDSGGSGLAGYRVYLDGAVTPTTTVTGNTYTSTGHGAYTSHYLRVEAFDNTGNATSSDIGISLYNPPYPRLGGYPIGGDHNYQTAAFIAAAAKRHVVFLTHFLGWQNSRGTTFAAVVQAIKAASTIGTRVYVYIITSSLYKAAASTGQAYWDPYNWLTVNNGFAYTNGLAETGKLTSAADSSQDQTNYHTTGKAVAGKRYFEYIIDFSLALHRDGLPLSSGAATFTAAPNTLLDGFFVDNVFSRERTNADYNRDGTVDGLSSVASMQAVQNSHVAAISYLRSRAPTWNVVVNSADWREYETAYGFGNFSGAPLYQKADGGAIEAVISYENLAFSSLISAINTQMNAYTAQKQGVMGWPLASLTDYTMMRYGLGVALLTGAYYYPYVGDYNAQDLQNLTFDEMAVNMGYRVGTPDTTARYQAGTNGEGVWRADFDNHIVLVAARRANGSTTPYSAITLETTFYRLLGTQAPSVNSGAAVTSITLSPRDAVILSRTPTVPTAVVASDNFRTRTRNSNSTISGSVFNSNWVPAGYQSLGGFSASSVKLLDRTQIAALMPSLLGDARVPAAQTMFLFAEQTANEAEGMVNVDIPAALNLREVFISWWEARSSGSRAAGEKFMRIDTYQATDTIGHDNVIGRGLAGEMALFENGPSVDPDYGEVGNSIVAWDGTLAHWEARLLLSTGTNSNGVYQFWKDGVQICNVTNVKFSNNTTQAGWNFRRFTLGGWNSGNSGWQAWPIQRIFLGWRLATARQGVWALPSS